MGKRSTLFIIVLFSSLLAGFVAIQFSWVQTLQANRLEKFKMSMQTGIHQTVMELPLKRSNHTLTTSGIEAALRRNFSIKEMGKIPFEFSIVSDSGHFASRGFSEKLQYDSSNLTLNYLLESNGWETLPDEVLVVVVPVWKKYALKDMPWIIAALATFTLIVLVSFIFAFVFIGRRQQLFYQKRDNVIKNMLQQLETPLCTVSVAAESLRNVQVMHDAGKIHYYQQVINEENQRMNEQVNKILRDFEE
jgi:hypothetical protein